MIWNMYTLHDVKALQYNPPFFALNDALAKRMIEDLVADLNTSVGRHPADFKLYRLGTYEDSKGEVVPLNIMEHVVDCIALVPPPVQHLPFDVRTDQPGVYKANGEVR